MDVRTCDPNQSAVFDAAQAVRAFAGLYRTLLMGFIDESDWDQVLCWRPATLEWSALEHTAHLAATLDAYGGCLACLVEHDSSREMVGIFTGWANAGPLGAESVVVRLSQKR